MSSSVPLRPRVIRLYKTLIFMGRDYPKSPDAFCRRVHDVFLRHRHETDEATIEQLLAKGEYVVKELEAMYMLKKYRTLKRRYYETEISLMDYKLNDFQNRFL